jgi:hypothetical protein
MSIVHGDNVHTVYDLFNGPFLVDRLLGKFYGKEKEVLEASTHYTVLILYSLYCTHHTVLILYSL